MPIIKSAIKKMYQDVRKTERNNVYRAELKSKIKALKKAVAQGKTGDLPLLLKSAYSIIDKNFKKKLIKRNTASRKKSSVARMIAAIGKTPVAA